MKIKQILLIAISIVLCHQAKAQKSVVDVNTLTGSSQIVIPIDAVQRGSVIIPVNLVYVGGGVKPKDVEGNAGMGWQVQTGGQVTRQLRGLPDDCKKDKSNFDRLGWIYNTNQSKISAFTPANTNTTCSNETTDITYLNNNFPNTSDTEPDIFYVSAPGLSCQLVWDQSMSTPGFRSINYEDLVITPTFNPTSGALTAFTILNDKGIKYTFSNPEKVDMKTVLASNATVKYYKTTYDQFINGISFNNNWHLTSVLDVNNNGVSITYTTGEVRNSTDPIVLYMGASGGNTITIPQYSIKQTVTSQTIDKISEQYNDDIAPILKFSWLWSNTGQMIINSIKRGARTFNFTYSSVAFQATAYKRYFLRNFFIGGCSSPINYKFGYAGETFSNDAYQTYTTALGDSTSTKIDYWGYYNGISADLKPALIVNPSNNNYARYAINVSSAVGADYTNALSGTNRSAHATNVIYGSLNKVYYATGGNTTIQYEPNSYLDVPSNTEVIGGGVRVKSITDDAVNASTVIVRNFNYASSPFVANSKTSGKPVSLPQYAFTTPYSGSATGNDYWNYSTIRSENDLSSEDHTIMYGTVTQSQTGAGYIVNNYYLPAMNWDNTSAPACASCGAEWSPTINYAARTNCASNYGPVKNMTGSYPFAPNINYDFERGLPLTAATYNESQLKVSEKSFTYQRTAAPVIIPALSIDDNINGSLTIKGYSKYAIYTSTGELVTTITDKVFDSPGSSSGQSVVSTSFYSNTHHKLVKQTTTNSDGSVLTNNIKYIKDFTTVGSSNADVMALSSLQARNINAPVESYQQVTTGGAAKTISASLMRFGEFTIVNGKTYMPLQSLKFFSADGDASFTPYQITSGIPSYYSGYIPVTNYNRYDDYGNIVTTDDAHKHTSTVITNHLAGKPEATFTNAAYDEIAFMDFDAALTPYFTSSGSVSYVTNDSHSGNAASMAAGASFSRQITKNTQARAYIFSAWIKAPSGSNTLTFALSGISNTTKTYTGTGNWKYYSFVLPAAGVTASFMISFTSNVAIMVDDLIFYPEQSEVNTYNYDNDYFNLIAQTNTNGISAYNVYDNFGRVTYSYDQDKNLLQKNTFITPADLQNVAPAAITYNGSAYSTVPIIFSDAGYNSCTAVGSGYKWNFGDGTGDFTTSNPSATHTYANNGSYTVTLTRTSLTLGIETVTKTIVVTSAPPPPTYVTLGYNNFTTGNGNITNVKFINNNGTSPVITVSGSVLNGYQLPTGTYNITVELLGGTQYNLSTDLGYGSIMVGSSANCKPYDGIKNTNTYVYNIYDLTTASSLYFNVYKTDCQPAN
ncbi:PKD domain-containing protein [Mucilaginibacter phyllosphaerae]|uniref:PKD domain-containing protein n=1 Tax=Mucilaginibacter phyllosphaerae TaxID=1812349 RepID=A0A4Y8ABH8_9SPHI|nr:PKD domain-containing protein [Mucilaginibacter phyllosphaerae]MBB3969319.1 hypothetical protein [Mucilaginibacter phyllosphaerae]TEW65887.1 PKD domain-containing protein [Mucilaginibacter phyllosphaerae]GGH07670.1 hypothetical protein GCM10007352_12520 [Mucilaginibacter phyllosphaerae]